LAGFRSFRTFPTQYPLVFRPSSMICFVEKFNDFYSCLHGLHGNWRANLRVHTPLGSWPSRNHCFLSGNCLASILSYSYVLPLHGLSNLINEVSSSHHTYVTDNRLCGSAARWFFSCLLVRNTSGHSQHFVSNCGLILKSN